jgi:hypothetical protein
MNLRPEVPLMIRYGPSVNRFRGAPHDARFDAFSVADGAGTAGNLDPLFRHVVPRHTFDPADPPLTAAIDRPLLPIGERGL